MKLSVAIIKEYLHSCGIDSELIGQNFKVKYHKYFYKSNPLDPEYIYFVNKNCDYKALPKQGNFVISNDYPVQELLSNNSRNIFIVHTDDSRAYDLIEKCFLTYLEWEQELTNAILYDISLPKILNICERYLKSPIVLTDSSFRVLARSEDNTLDIEDREWQFIKEHGYHSTAFIDNCLNDPKFQRCMQKPDIFPYHIHDVAVAPPNDANNNLRYSSIQVPITMAGQLVAFMSTLIKESIQPWIIDLSIEIGQIIRIAFSHGRTLLSPNILENNTIRDFLLQKSKSNMSESILTKELSYKQGDSLYVITLQLGEKNAAGSLMILSALIDNLQEKKRLNYCYTVRMDKTITIIVNESKNKSNRLRLFDISKEYMLKNELYAGISLSTTAIDTLPVLYNQTLFVLNDIKKVFPGQHKLFYDNFIVDDLVANIKSPSLLTAMIHPLANTLKQDEKNADLYNTLCAYVLCFFDSDATARNIHVHRNTVYYRLKKIEELAGVSLNDPILRMQLIISISILQR